MKYSVLISLLLGSFFLFACTNGDSKTTAVTTQSQLAKKTVKKEKIAKKTVTKEMTPEKKTVSTDEPDDKEDQTVPMTKEQLDKAKSLIKEAGDVSDIDAKKLFKHQCTSCHGRKGNLGINGAKKLNKSKINLENAVAQVYFGKGLMTSYKQILSPKEIVAVAKYAETLRK